MRLRLERWFVAGAAILFAGVAGAQADEAGASAGPISGASDNTPSTAPSPDAIASRDMNLTPQQMVDQASGHVARIDQASQSVRRQLTAARAERDVVKVLCLNDKLNQIDVALASAGDRLKSLEAMVQDNDADRAKHEYTIIAVLRERVETLVSEANQCVGEEVGYVGDTAVTVDVDPEIPDTDPYDFPEDTFVGQPPRLRSPTY